MICQNFNHLVHCHRKLLFDKVIKLDVCGSLVFSNSVTYIKINVPGSFKSHAVTYVATHLHAYIATKSWHASFHVIIVNSI